MLIVLATLAFVLEAVAWVTLARWGWQTGNSASVRWALALLAPLAFMVFWGLFLSPKATFTLPVNLKSSLQLLVFALAACAAWPVWGRPFALAFFALVVVTIFTARLSGGQS